MHHLSHQKQVENVQMAQTLVAPVSPQEDTEGVYDPMVLRIGCFHDLELIFFPFSFSFFLLRQPLDGNSVHGRGTEAPQRINDHAEVSPALLGCPAGASASRNDDMSSQGSTIDYRPISGRCRDAFGQVRELITLLSIFTQEYTIIL